MTEMMTHAETVQAHAPAAPAPSRGRRLIPVVSWFALILLLLAWAGFLAWFFTPAISEPDDNGYFAQGTLLAQTGHTFFSPGSDAEYLGMHWLLTPSGVFISRYPPGLAIGVALLAKVGGWKLSLWLNPLLSLAALMGFFLLARMIVPAGFALLGVVVLAWNQTFARHALSGDAHMGVACCIIWTIYFLFRWSREGKAWQVAAAGLALGCAGAVRYPDLIMGLGAGIFLLCHARRNARLARHLGVFALGVAIPLIPLLIRNQLLLGAFWRTGYSLTNEESGFSWNYFRQHAVDYVQQINGSAIGLFFSLGFLGILCMLFRRGWRAIGAMLGVSSTLMLLLYMAYYWAPGGASQMTLRFLLPVFPLYILAGLWLLWQTGRSLSKGGAVAVALIVLALQLVWGTSDVLAQAAELQQQKIALALVTQALEGVARPQDVVIAAQNLAQQLDFVRQWKIADPSVIRTENRGRFGFGGMMNDDDANAPSPDQPAKLDRQRRLYPGSLAKRQRKFLRNVALWAGSDHDIYVVGTEREALAWSGIAGAKVRIERRIQLPRFSSGNAMRGRGMAGRPMGGPGFGGGPGFPGPPAGGGGFGGGPGFFAPPGPGPGGFGAGAMGGPPFGGSDFEAASEYVIAKLVLPAQNPREIPQ